jgi:hypothetical protein
MSDNQCPLETPLLENLPMIDRAFALSTTAHDEDWDMASWPGMIGDNLIEALQAINPAVMTSLFAILQPTVKGTLIGSLEDLERCAAENKEDCLEELEVEDLGEFSNKHLEVFLLQRATYPKHIDWRKLVNLLYDANNQEKQAIDWFFWEFHRTSTLSLLGSKAMEIEVPSALLPNNQVKQEGGETFIHCDVANAWLRDDEFYRQYEVSVNDYSINCTGIVGYAGTLEQAFAKATLYTLSNNAPKKLEADPLGNMTFLNGQFAEITLRRRKSLVAKADLKKHSSGNHKLEWNIVPNGSMEAKQVKSALYATEKALSLQWSKVHDLEDALGL